MHSHWNHEFSRSPPDFPLLLYYWTSICHAYAEVDRKYCDLISFPNRGKIYVFDAIKCTVMRVCVCVIHFGPPISVSNSVYKNINEITHMTKEKLNFPMSWIANICVCVRSTYVVFLLMVLYIAHRMGFSIMTKFLSIYLFHSTTKRNVRLKSLELSKTTCVYFNFCNKKRRRREKPYSKTPLCSRNHFIVYIYVWYVRVCMRYQIKFFAWLISIY